MFCITLSFIIMWMLVTVLDRDIIHYMWIRVNVLGRAIIYFIWLLVDILDELPYIMYVDVGR